MPSEFLAEIPKEHQVTLISSLGILREGWRNSSSDIRFYSGEQKSEKRLACKHKLKLIRCRAVGCWGRTRRVGWAGSVKKAVRLADRVGHQGWDGQNGWITTAEHRSSRIFFNTLGKMILITILNISFARLHSLTNRYSGKLPIRWMAASQTQAYARPCRQHGAPITTKPNQLQGVY